MCWHPMLLGTIDDYLRPTPTLDSGHPEVRPLAQTLAAAADDRTDFAARAFRWVRDEVRHSRDHRLTPVTCTASDVLAHRSGYCYAKSHLLVALLRACDVPAGLCYQRLCRDDNGRDPYSLHGLCAVLLEDFGWYRIDPRGNRPDVQAEFCPPVERLAFRPHLAGEVDYPELWPDAHPDVVRALNSHTDAQELWHHLPDAALSTAKPSNGGPL